jgi:hypothetical protein
MLIKLKMTLKWGKEGEGLLIYQRRRECENPGPHASLACEDASFLVSLVHEVESLRRSLQPVEGKYSEVK